MPYKLLVILLFLAAFDAASAQVLVQNEEAGHLPHANLRTEMLYGADFVAEQQAVREGRPRSIPLALGLSAAVPGLGQMYNRQWLKAAAFIAAEAALWTGYVVWHNQGIRGEREFIAFAHEHWSPKRYADWLSGYSGYPGEPIPVPAHIDFSRPENWTDAQRQEISAFFQQIRSAENISRYVNTGALFSHKLEPFGDQQYYELIGKYFQYAPGWNDYNGADNPLEVDADGNLINVSPRFLEYAAMHQRANDLLRRASRITSVVLVNHFISAIDAAVFAKIHNDRLESSLSFHYDMDGQLAPLAVVRLTF